MRYIIGLGVAILGLAISGNVCSAQQAPYGSYQQTCRNIGVRGNVLYAECQDANRHWRSAQLADYQRCRGEIQNLNGSLQCTGAGGRGGGGYQGGGYARDRDRDHDRDWDWDRDHRSRIPRGSYVQTCQDIRVNGNDLQARCQKKNGGWKNASLGNFYRCRDIENDNGKLRCR
jgi:CVNH domain